MHPTIALMSTPATWGPLRNITQWLIGKALGQLCCSSFYDPLRESRERQAKVLGLNLCPPQTTKGETGWPASRPPRISISFPAILFPNSTIVHLEWLPHPCCVAVLWETMGAKDPSLPEQPPIPSEDPPAHSVCIPHTAANRVWGEGGQPPKCLGAPAMPFSCTQKPKKTPPQHGHSESEPFKYKCMHFNLEYWLCDGASLREVRDGGKMMGNRGSWTCCHPKKTKHWGTLSWKNPDFIELQIMKRWCHYETSNVLAFGHLYAGGDALVLLPVVLKVMSGCWQLPSRFSTIFHPPPSWVEAGRVHCRRNIPWP